MLIFLRFARISNLYIAEKNYGPVEIILEIELNSYFRRSEAKIDFFSLSNSTEVFVRGGQRRFSSIVSVAMSGLKPYTIFAARR